MLASAPRLLRGWAPLPSLPSLLHPSCRGLASSPSLPQQLKPRPDTGGQLAPSKGEKVKEGAKTATYSLVILAGIGMFGTVFYTVYKELFSSNSPNSLYDKAVVECLAHAKLVDMLGEPIRAFGEPACRHLPRGGEQEGAEDPHRPEAVPGPPGQEGRPATVLPAGGPWRWCW